MKLIHKKAISTKGMTAVDQSIFPFRDSVWGFCLFICVPLVQFYKIICDIEHYSIVMEEMQGENTENPYENGTVQPCRFLSARSGQEVPGICLMEIRTELLHGDKTERQKGPRQAPAGYRRSVRGLLKRSRYMIGKAPADGITGGLRSW